MEGERKAPEDREQGGQAHAGVGCSVRLRLVEASCSTVVRSEDVVLEGREADAGSGACVVPGHLADAQC